mmetsp:Transcript_26313/g.61337  ORF Transcript_26313/g.61337 Transcript_26313/m.61337 type:complete len:80 (-) Transcript_26313:81-320(-)
MLFRMRQWFAGWVSPLKCNLLPLEFATFSLPTPVRFHDPCAFILELMMGLRSSPPPPLRRRHVRGHHVSSNHFHWLALS